MSEPEVDRAEGSAAAAPRGPAYAPVRRPRGIYLLSLIILLGGLFLAVHHLRVFDMALTSEAGPVDFSPAYLFNALSEMLLAFTAIIGALTLFFGAKMGWWLTALYLPWNRARDFALVASTVSQETVQEEWLAASIRTSIFALMFLYLFRRNVLEFCGLAWLPRIWVGIALFWAGVAIAFFLNPFNGVYSISNEVTRW